MDPADGLIHILCRAVETIDSEIPCVFGRASSLANSWARFFTAPSSEPTTAKNRALVAELFVFRWVATDFRILHDSWEEYKEPDPQAPSTIEEEHGFGNAPAAHGYECC